MQSRSRSVVSFVVALGLTLASGGPAGAQADFVNFESGHVRPLALSPDGNRLFAVNTPDNRLAIYDVTAGALTLAAEVEVGLEPVAVAARTDTEVWVVNHLSDSVSVVDVDPVDATRSRVRRTLLTCDEPRDVVFAGTAGDRAFVTTARRGQNCPVAASLTTPGIGRAVVQVFAATSLGAPLGGTPIANVVLFSDTPRALAVSPDGATVYAAAFHSGNRTTALFEGVVDANGGLPPMPPGATPNHPDTGLIVKFDPVAGEWQDEVGRDWSAQVPFSLPDRDVFLIDATATPPQLAAPPNAVTGVGTILFNMAVRPDTGRVYVANSEARNEVRFEPRLSATQGVQGEISHNRLTVIAGTAPTAHHLNPHIDYDCVPPCDPGAAERAESLAFPMDLVFSGDGSRVYVVGFGSGKLGIFDTDDLEAGLITKTLVPVGLGPSGVVLDEARDQAFVMNRIDHTISIVSAASAPATAAETAVVPLRFDPSPPAARDGRRFLYDALETSGHGDQACATCHVFGDFDSLAWDLGDPFGAVEPNPNPFRVGSGGPFHPLKGPMTTQSLRGMADAGPMHWRGDRTAGGAQALNEDLAFKEFNPAFVGLLGRTAELSAPDMQAFTDFILTVAYPPNPIRALSDTPTAAEAAGFDFFLTSPTDAGAITCEFCHRMPLGTDGFSTIEGEPQEFKIAHLRNLYQKVGMFGVAGDQVRGFGYLHDGSVPTIFNFVSSSVFVFPSNTVRRQVEAFMLAFDTGQRPAVGQQVTVGPNADAAVTARVTLLVGRADVGDCDLVAHGVLNGEQRGAAYVGGDRFQPDRNDDPTVSRATILGFAGTAGQEVTFTCAPVGSGERVGIDRDRDGVYDRTELDCGTDPADPASTPALPCGAGTTTSTSSSTSSSTVVTTSSSSTSSSTAPTTSSSSTSSSTSSSSVPGSTTSTTTVPPDGVVTIQTRALKLRDGSAKGTPDGRKLSFKSRTKTDPSAHRIVPPARGGSGDPMLAGATLTVYNAAGSGESFTTVLPAAGWLALGSAEQPRGFKFRSLDVSAPVQRAVLKDDLLKVKAKGSTWGYTLDEPSQGRVAVRFTAGAGPTWCADAPGRAGKDRQDLFVSEKNVSAPGVCPPLP